MLSHELVQKNKIQGKREKKRGRIRVLHITQAHLTRGSMVRESNTTDPKSYMAVNIQFRGGCLFKNEKHWPPIAIVHGIRPFIKLHLRDGRLFREEKMPGGYAELSTKIVSKSISVQHRVYYAKRSE